MACSRHVSTPGSMQPAQHASRLHLGAGDARGPGGKGGAGGSPGACAGTPGLVRCLYRHGRPLASASGLHAQHVTSSFDLHAKWFGPAVRVERWVVQGGARSLQSACSRRTSAPAVAGLQGPALPQPQLQPPWRTGSAWLQRCLKRSLGDCHRLRARVELHAQFQE